MTAMTATNTMCQASRSQVDLEIIIILTYLFYSSGFSIAKRCNIRDRLYIVALVFLLLHLFLLLVLNRVFCVEILYYMVMCYRAVSIQNFDDLEVATVPNSS